MRVLWRVNLMLVLNLSLLNKEYTLIIVLKALASIITLCGLRVRIRVTLWPTVSRPVCLCLKHACRAYGQILITVKTVSSLTRERVCHLQLLLVLASAVILGPSPAGFMTIFYCLRFDTPPTWRARSPYLYPPGTGFSFTSPHTTRMVTVEVFEPSSTRGVLWSPKSKSHCDWRSANR
jgi:hypothetical protein